MQGKEVGAMHNQSDESPNAFSGAPPVPLLASMDPPSLSASPLAASGPFTTPPSTAATIALSLSEAKALIRASTLSSTQCASSPQTAWGTGAIAASKSKWGSMFRRWLKTREKARPSRARLLSSTNLSALTDRASSCVTTSVKN